MIFGWAFTRRRKMEVCAKCGTYLFDEVGGSRKIFRSFYTKEKEGSKYYLCINCAENKTTITEEKNEAQDD
jgi:hypothetical protein